MSSQVYGMNPTAAQVNQAISNTQEVYKPIPETTCDHRAICCKAGCPNMYYAEFLSIRREFVDKMTKEERLELTMECIKRYIQPQIIEKPKPCVFLGDKNMCGVYSSRPLKCRFYGLLPKELYNRIVSETSQEIKVPKEKIPLCMQCDRVKIKDEYRDKFPDGTIPEKMIKDMEKALRENDRTTLGMPPEIQKDGFGFLTYHDWHVMFELDESWMATLTQVRINFTDIQKEQFIDALKTALHKE